MISTPLILLLLSLGKTEVVASTDLPESWRVAPISGRATPAAHSEFKRTLPIVRREMKRYPTKVLSNLVRVQIIKEINFYGQPYGGTNSNDTVYLTVDGLDKGYTDEYLASAFHHEFSSILLRNFPTLLNQKAWAGTLPNDFKYSGNGVIAIAEGKANTSIDTTLAAQGFLSQYSQSALEEDFNVIAQNLFTGGKEFWKLVDKYPKAAEKVRLVIKFYNKLDNTFNEKSFRRHR